MKLEAGIWYKDRVGRVVGPMEVDRDRVFPFKGRGEDGQLHRYRPDGKWNNSSEEHARDLIERVEAPVAIDPEDGTYEIRASEYEPESFGTAYLPEYEPLGAVLQEAFAQASTGKGKERHANGKPFLDQPIMSIGRMCGLGFQTGQIQKKVQEATSMAARGDSDAAIREILGAINYAAAAILLIREQGRA